MIGSYLSVLRRRGAAIVLLSALLAPALFVAIGLGGTSYRSEAVVQTGSSVAASVVNLDTPYEAPESRLATEIEFFESDGVTERAREALVALGWTESAVEMRERVTIAPRGVSTLVDITGVHSEPQRAQELTAAFVDAYVTHRRALQQAAVQEVVDDLEAQRAEAEADLLALSTEDAPASAAPLIASAQSWYETLSARVEGARLRLAVDTSGIALVSPASAPEPVEGIRPTTAAALSALGAFLAACGAALLLDVLRDPVRTRTEAQLLLGVPALGELPQSRTGGRRKMKGALTDRRHPLVTGARGVRLRLERLLDDGEPGTVMVVATRDDARDAVAIAAGLAESWHLTGRRAVVVTGVERGRDAQRLLEPSGETRRLGALTARRTTAGVWVVPATSPDDAQAGFLDQPDPAAALAEIHRTFDVVLLVDSTSAAMDAVALGNLTDATLLVCALGRTRAKRLQDVADTLADFGGHVDGVVLTRPWWSRRTAQGARSHDAVAPDAPRGPRSAAMRGTAVADRHPQDGADDASGPTRASETTVVGSGAGSPHGDPGTEGRA
ncbi:hypothetical protein N866_04100 [Actinotalea ferrariae CF5-4]|uniref:Lipopolysaccharide biosynthesis protein n=1 Tax=Actinotalea ferrariae CF5-4 TaxID=948458 RepID=A0A021VV62_9CELL|nr:hypothetical protein [Actinotalea ferrariae]EYR62952.1 hypothetical protein N866_04100 [Actinotalea ferrariae CF5-4]